MDLATWSPFQSPQVRAICAHFTPEERRRAVWRGCGYGAWVFATLTGPGMIAWDVGTSIAWAAAGLVWAVHVACLPLWQRHVWRFLASTEWARAQGISPYDLALFKF